MRFARFNKSCRVFTERFEIKKKILEEIFFLYVAFINAPIIIWLFAYQNLINLSSWCALLRFYIVDKKKSKQFFAVSMMKFSIFCSVAPQKQRKKFIKSIFSGGKLIVLFHFHYIYPHFSRLLLHSNWIIDH